MSIARAIRDRIERRLPPKAANFWCHVTEGAFASFGGAMVGGQLFAVLVAALGGSAATLGALTSIGSFTFLAPLLLAPRVEATRRKKRLVLLLGLGQRLPHVVIVALLILLAADRPILCLYAIAVVQLMGGLCTSVLYAPWQDLIAETVPIGRVGRLFGFRNLLSHVLGLPSAGLCGLVIAVFAFPASYQLLYLLSFAVMMVSWGLFALVDEIPPGAAPARRKSATHYFRDLLAAMREDKNYRHYLLCHIFIKSGDPVVLFFALAAVKQMHQASWVVLSGVATSVAAIGGNLFLPFVGEKIGPKRMLGLSLAGRAGAMVLAALVPAGVWLAVPFFVLGLCGAGQAVAGPPLMMRIFPRGKRVGYITLSSVALAPFRILMPLAAGLISQTLGFQALFALAGAWVLAALLPLSRIRLAPEPRTTAEPDERDGARSSQAQEEK